MKKYTSSASKRLMMFTLISCAVFSTGIVLAFADVANIVLPIVLILTGGLLGIIFFSCFLAEKSRSLVIRADRIVFPRGAEVNQKTVFQKTVVMTNDIRSIEIKRCTGDRLITKDTNFYLLKLKDGNTVAVTLYQYGKEAEKEIFETIKSLIE